jgi:DnaD/phage-associated family protein
MPRWRKLHVKATESLDINDMPDDFHRLLWVLLPLGLDREGRGLDNPAWIKAKIMPLRVDVTPADISAAMDWYERRGMVVRYQVETRAYFMVPTFGHYQGNTTREAESEYPAPTPELMQNSCNGHAELVQNSGSDSDTDADTNTEETFVSSSVRAFENAIGMIAGPSMSKEINAALGELWERGLTDWWQMALDVSCDNNKRSWSYMRGILDNWIREGKPSITRPKFPVANSPPETRMIEFDDPVTGTHVVKEVPA